MQKSNTSTAPASPSKDYEAIVNGMAPLRKERLDEELAARSASATKITKMVYSFLDALFCIKFEVGEGKKYVAKIHVKDKKKLTWKESRTIVVCLLLLERLNIFESFEKLKAKLAESSLTSSFDVIVQDGVNTVNIVPCSVGGTVTAGRVSQEGFTIDKDDDFIVQFKTDTETFVFVVNHECIDNSFGMLQTRALADCLYIGEPGDKMDRSMFLQYCATLRKKYNMIKVSKQGDSLLGYIVPTALKEEDWGVAFVSEIELPPHTDVAIDWSPETKARVEATAVATLRTMFPEWDLEILSMILESNNYHVRFEMYSCCCNELTK
jgi:hypothetical protein